MWKREACDLAGAAGVFVDVEEDGADAHVAGGVFGAFVERRVEAPDDILFDSDPDFNISDIEFPSLSDDNVSSGPAPGGDTARSDQLKEPAVAGPAPGHGGAHRGRSLSVDDAFFEGLGFQQGVGGHHKRSGSTDGSTSPFEGDSSTGTSSDYAKKAMAADKLAELALIDPKRAKRCNLVDLFSPLCGAYFESDWGLWSFSARLLIFSADILTDFLVSFMEI